MIGRSLGRYRILESLGEGGMGRVYVAEDPSLGRRVAIKVLPPEVSRDVAYRARLLLEARAASALNHPNILTVYDFGEDDETLFVATELVDGRTLREWAAERTRTPAEILTLLRQATRALAVAHAQGLVHRDLKPENMMVRKDGLLKILDFGLARSVSPELGQATLLRTAPGTILGTAPYMSPEQVLAQPAGPASDVFSVGTLLYELLTGTHPFTAASSIEIMHRILHESPPPPSRLAPGVPPELDFVLAKAMAKDPARRYAAAREFDVDLETCETGFAAAAAVSAAAAAGAARASPSTASRIPAAATSRPRAIAVLPFKNVGGNPDLDYLGLGLADAVINRLSTSPDLVVRATSTIGRFEKQLVEPAQVARELDVTAVLDASYQRAGDRFRATARLVDADGRALWAGKVDLAFADVFEVQDEVASGISSALTARLVTPPATAIEPRDPRAFDLSMRALKEYQAGTRAGFERAIGLYEEAVRVDPRSVDAWVGLARTYHSMFDSGFDPDPIWLQRSAAANQKARALDPDHPVALFQEGAAHIVAGRKPEAYRALVEAHRRLPNDSMVLHYLGYLFRLCGMLEAFDEAERLAIELDPTQPWPYWAQIRIAIERGRMEEARSWIEQARLRFADHQATEVRAWSLRILEGGAEDVLREMDRLEGSMERHSGIVLDRAWALAVLGRRDEARTALVSLDAASRVDMDVAAYAGMIEGLLGDPDAAFRWLDRATELGNDSVYLYENPRMFGALHGDPRWPAFIAGVRARSEEARRAFAWPID